MVEVWPLEVLPRGLALEQPRGAGEEAQLIDALVDLLARDVAHRLAGVARLQPADLVASLGDRGGEVEQVGLPATRGEPLPGLPRRAAAAAYAWSTSAARRHRGASVDLARRGVDEVEELGGGGLDQLAVDEVADRLTHGGAPQAT